MELEACTTNWSSIDLILYRDHCVPFLGLHLSSIGRPLHLHCYSIIFLYSFFLVQCIHSSVITLLLITFSLPLEIVLSLLVQAFPCFLIIATLKIDLIELLNSEVQLGEGSLKLE